MTIVFLILSIGMLWLHLLGLGLAAYSLHKDYAVARVGSVLVFCLGLFFFEHFQGLGPQPPLLLLTLPLSGWLVWRYRKVLQENWEIEAFFAVGFSFALVWRCTFPDIDLGPEFLPDLMFIQSYAAGETLPATDRWLPPFNVSFYYGFQHYGTALMGRVLRLTPEVSFQLGICALSGLLTCATGAAAKRFSGWRPAGWLMTAVMLIGGGGTIVALHVLAKEPVPHSTASLFIGTGLADDQWSPLGKWCTENLGIGKPGLALIFDSFSYTVADGQFHPPQIGFVLLGFMALLIAAIETQPDGRQRLVHHGLLAATVPMGVIGNIWVAPLQAMLLGAWLIYRTFRGERKHWFAVVIGGGVSLALCYPHLLEFTQAHGSPAPIRPTLASDHAHPADWILLFWPVLILLALGFWQKNNKTSALFLILIWVGLLFFSEFYFADDFLDHGGNRLNSTLKWWPWIYMGIIVTLGSLNLGSTNRWCRWGTVATLSVTCLYGVDLWRFFRDKPKPSVLKLAGSNWIAESPAMKDLIFALSARPDGICLESGNPRAYHTDITALTAFAHKSSFLGWPIHEETLWRGKTSQVSQRQIELDLFYKDKLPDPLNWLRGNNISYVLWLQRDQDPCFKSLKEKLRPRYHWVFVYGNEAENWNIGFFELHPELNKPEKR